jgi:hypothetical protein
MSNPRFPDYPDFQPTFTPKEMFEQGIFGGAYYRPIHSGITNQDYKNQDLEFEFLSDLDRSLTARPNFDFSINKWKVKAGSSLLDWESKGWIKSIDPYGWVQWYCRFYSGRRSHDDSRQIDRWNKYAGSTSGRWRTNIANKIKDAGGIDYINDPKVSPVVRQGLLQWAYEISPADYLAKTM